MAADGEVPPPPPEETLRVAPEEIEDGAAGRCAYLQKFKLYETRSKFYMIGRGESREFWRVLKIDRLDPSELNVREDSTVYTVGECQELLRRIHEGNRPTGGLKFITNCYGIIGFVKFLGPYYMLLITKRRLIGNICGHKIYAITKCRMITIPNPTVQSDVSNSKDENRYKKLLCTVDLTKDFFFSYSYHIMRSLQKNLCDSQKGQVVYETMFVWNEFLTRGIRNNLKSTLWIVALVYGFFKQAKLSTSGKEFKLTLIARRSRHYAGTRFLKRGVNEKGRVANDVETEQIVCEEISGAFPTRITSVVQNRGSIPLFWSQETSKLNIKPDIVVHKKDQSYEATRLHFENLAKRYGNPIIILNLIKTRERKPRESILRAEFANAIDYVNKGLSKEDRLRFLHWDLSRQSRRKATCALELLGRVAANALTLTGFLHCQVTPALKINNVLRWPPFGEDEDCECSGSTHSESTEISDATRNGYMVDGDEPPGNYSTIVPTFQRGVLRTNCIDCLDRTNVAQYAYGLVALGHQLHVLGLLDDPKINLDDTLADELMSFYEIMGDTLALQYTGSAAHNKIFCERRGHWKAAIQSQEFFRTLQRYYSNAYVDAEKQDAINVFLGHFQPQQGKPALWELDSDQHVGRQAHDLASDKSRAFFRRSLSDGNILCHDKIQGANTRQTKQPSSRFSNGSELIGDSTDLFECTPDISTCESDISCPRYTAAMSGRQLFVESDHISLSEHVAYESNCSNFLDLDWLSSSGNSCEDEFFERSSMLDSPAESLSTENIINGCAGDTASRLSEKKSSLYLREELSVESELPNCGRTISEHFVDWVHNGGTFYL